MLLGGDEHKFDELARFFAGITWNTKRIARLLGFTIDTCKIQNLLLASFGIEQTKSLVIFILDGDVATPVKKFS